jgi:hypothetical protein
VTRKAIVLSAVAAGAAALVVFSGWVTAALVMGTSAIGWGVYRRRSARNSSPAFFGEAGEETRLTEIKPGPAGDDDGKPPPQ